MTSRWYYCHHEQTLGPVSEPELRQLAAQGKLVPEDLIWPEDKGRDQAVAAQAALDFSARAPVAPAAPASAAVPDWLADIAQAEQPVVRAPAMPDRGKAPGVSAGTGEALAVELAPPLLPSSEGPCRLSVGCATSRGRIRKRNEDHFLVQQFAWSAGEEVHEATLLVVADGMGGHQAGDRASGLVIGTLAGKLSPILAGLLRGPSHETGTAVLTRAVGDALQECHRVVTQVAASDAGSRGMGSTVAVAVIWDGQAFISHVGDCRVYHYRGGLTQVTQDHSIVARMIELGQLTVEEAATHAARNEVTQAIGTRSPIEPSQHTLDLARGDWLLLASDGLCAHVEVDTLGTLARQAAPSAAYLARRLVELANEGGGSDNCTVVTAWCY
jgi:protein phosphatase